MLKLYAILADIHSNFDALKAVAKHARRVARQEHAELDFICLGDVVDYGPEPNECVKWIEKNAAIKVLGNHDQDVIAAWDTPPKSISNEYWPITIWTRFELKPGLRDQMRRWPDQARLVNESSGQAFLLYHSSQAYPHRYIRDETNAWDEFGKLETPYVLFGHTHHQGYFIKGDGEYRKATICLAVTRPWKQSLHENWHIFPVSQWHTLSQWEIPGALFNPGSVGQPRRHPLLFGTDQPYEEHACYMLLAFDDLGHTRFQFCQVPYQASQTTIPKLQSLVHWSKDRCNGSGVLSHEQIQSLRASDNPQQKKMAQIIDEMPSRLPELVNNVLIPTLKSDKGRF